MNPLTPMKAIRAKCLDCCLNDAREVRECPATGCPLHAYRFGRMPGKGASPLGAIRKRCLDCVGFERKRVAECKRQSCPLWSRRTGARPRRNGPLFQKQAADRGFSGLVPAGMGEESSGGAECEI